MKLNLVYLDSPEEWVNKRNDEDITNYSIKTFKCDWYTVLNINQMFPLLDTFTHKQIKSANVLFDAYFEGRRKLRVNNRYLLLNIGSHKSNLRARAVLQACGLYEMKLFYEFAQTVDTDTFENDKKEMFNTIQQLQKDPTVSNAQLTVLRNDSNSLFCCCSSF